MKRSAAWVQRGLWHWSRSIAPLRMWFYMSTGRYLWFLGLTIFLKKKGKKAPEWLVPASDPPGATFLEVQRSTEDIPGCTTNWTSGAHLDRARRRSPGSVPLSHHTCKVRAQASQVAFRSQKLFCLCSRYVCSEGRVRQRLAKFHQARESKREERAKQQSSEQCRQTRMEEFFRITRKRSGVSRSHFIQDILNLVSFWRFIELYLIV